MMGLLTWFSNGSIKRHCRLTSHKNITALGAVLFREHMFEKRKDYLLSWVILGDFGDGNVYIYSLKD